MKLQEKINEITGKVEATITEQKVKVEEKVKATVDQLQGTYPAQFETINAYTERISGKVNKQLSGFDKDALVADVKEELNIITGDVKTAVDKGLESIKSILSK